MMTLPPITQAIAIGKIGGPEVIEKITLPFPEVEPDHVVVKMEYFGINHIDTYYRKGLYPIDTFPFVLGCEGAGRIVALPTDPKIANIPEFRMRRYTLGKAVAINHQRVHAEYVSVPWKSALPLPENISASTAASILVQGLTAVTFMEDAYKVKRGDTVFIHTVAGGLGILMTQLAKHLGATVIGTTSTQDKANYARSNGADHVILYKTEDVVARVLEITRGEGVNAIFDGVGRDTFDIDFEIIKRKGTLVSVGNASGAVPPFELLKLSSKNVTLVRPTMGNYNVTFEEVHRYGRRLVELIDSDTLKARVHKEYPFSTEGIRQAHTDLSGGQTTGKLVVKVP